MLIGVNKKPPPLELLRYRDGDSSLSGQFLKDFRVCKTCGEWHQALHSIGTLKCRFHPLSLNEDCESLWHRQGVYPCCGVSPNPRDKDFDATFAKGCTHKDHSAVHCIPCPTKVEEVDWPSILRASLHDDIELINRSKTSSWEKLVKELHYRGIRIDPSTNRFYLSRVDDYMVQQRLRHKYFKDERLSLCLRIHVVKEHDGGETVSSYKEIVVDKAMTIGQVRKLHFPELNNMTITEGLNEYTESMRVEQLGSSMEMIEEKEYKVVYNI